MAWWSNNNRSWSQQPWSTNRYQQRNAARQEQVQEARAQLAAGLAAPPPSTPGPTQEPAQPPSSWQHGQQAWSRMQINKQAALRIRTLTQLMAEAPDEQTRGIYAADLRRVRAHTHADKSPQQLVEI